MSGRTLAEKILSHRLGRPVEAGEFVVAPVDLVLAHEGTAVLAIERFEALGRGRPAIRVLLFLDHAAPAPRAELANVQRRMRAFAAEMGARLYGVGSGICHQIVAERWAAPGQIIVGADSHTCTAGALGAFATGMGSTDVGVAMAFGATWFRVPETLRLDLTGRGADGRGLPPGVTAKDVILHIIGLLGDDGAVYRALEFGGPVVEALDVEGRMTLCNMAVEAGAKAGLCPSDDATRRFLEDMGRGEAFAPLHPDPDARYERRLEVDLSDLSPRVAAPPAVDNVRPVEELVGLRIDQVLIGTCTNGRLADLRLAARILAGRRVHPDVRLLVAPASRRVYAEALAEGLIEVLVRAGAAASFARIFFRNAINVGLLPVICDTGGIETGDMLEIDLGAGVVRDLTRGFTRDFAPLPRWMLRIVEDGGIVPHILARGGFGFAFTAEEDDGCV